MGTNGPSTQLVLRSAAYDNFRIDVRHNFWSFAYFVFICFLRKFSGGVHLPITICSIVTGFVAALIPLISLNFEVIILLNTATLIIVSMYAPNEFEYVNPTRWDKWLKWISISLVTVNFIVMIPEITLAFFVQAILILPVWTKCKGGG